MLWLVIFIMAAIIVFILAQKDSSEGAEQSSAMNDDTAFNGHYYTQDDIIYKDGQYYENENSEDWEEFEYEISEDERFK